MTEICDYVTAAACLLTTNGEEVKETATCRVIRNEEGHVKPDEGEVVATKNSDMDNEKEKCYWSASTPVLSCGQQQLVRKRILSTLPAIERHRFNQNSDISSFLNSPSQ